MTKTVILRFCEHCVSPYPFLPSHNHYLFLQIDELDCALKYIALNELGVSIPSDNKLCVRLVTPLFHSEALEIVLVTS